ncbi:MAG TPA: hypothetical protein QF641_02860 [Candidatus Thalassarchaeaceae archaeon]|jgi:hypothetical protein|nr:hypothetical protein [Candidatus Thalassarchaeaceae archaeon]|tara:strand:+ start:33242 stop:34075 length:834 start_codon:yes stop_codon:yes gene_type:complete
MSSGGPGHHQALDIDSILFRTLLSEGKKEQAIKISENILQRSRSIEERNHETEAWIRMERALLGTIDHGRIGEELRWCVERLSATSTGTEIHGIALLNLGSWHRNNGEPMMALVILSDISSSSGHSNEVIGISRLESGRILVEIGDLESAMRHLWIALKRLSGSGMSAESIVCAMEWLDIALDDVKTSSPRMLERITNAQPRETSGISRAPSNPDDVREVINSIIPHIFLDLSGDPRDDLGLVIDAGNIIGESTWLEEMLERSGEIQDSRLIEALQS